MSWQFERVAGPFEGEANGIVWDGSAFLVALKDEGRILRYDPATRSVSEARRYTNRVNGLALGPKGQLYGAQEGGRRLVEMMRDGRMGEVHAKLDGRWQVVCHAHREQAARASVQLAYHDHVDGLMGPQVIVNKFGIPDGVTTSSKVYLPVK